MLRKPWLRMMVFLILCYVAIDTLQIPVVQGFDNSMSGVDVALIIDTSGSMSSNDTYGLRREAAKVFIDTALVGDRIAVVAFDSYATVLASLQTIQSQADRDSLKNAVNKVGSYGSTDINGGLDLGFSQLKNSPDNAAKAAILLTDGQHNVGVYKDNSHLQYQAKGWPIYTIGLGSSADATLLRKVAVATGGTYQSLTSAAQLQAVYFDIAQTIRGGRTIVQNAFRMQQGDTRTISSIIPVKQESATFFVTWPGSEVTLNVTTPSGRGISASTQSSDVYHAKGATYELFTIQNPESGQWRLKLFGVSLASGGEDVSLRVAIKGPSQSFLPAIRGISAGSLPTVTPTPTPTIQPTTRPTNTAAPTATTRPTNTAVPTATSRPTNTAVPTSLPIVSRILWASDRDGDYEIYVMNADGTNQHPLTSNISTDRHPIASPDGSLIVFDSERDGNAEIYVMNADGTNQRRLTQSAQLDVGPKWSPDGRYIVFRSDRDGNPEIYVMNADGSNQRRLTTTTSEEGAPAWSPDGRYIVFRSDRDGQDEIYVMNADGSNPKRLTISDASDGVPVWSPNGQLIAFRTNRDGNDEIYVMNTDGSGQRRLTHNAVFDSDPAWSPDGRAIVFRSDRDGNQNVYVMNIDGSSQTGLTTHAKADADPSWISP